MTLKNTFPVLKVCEKALNLVMPHVERDIIPTILAALNANTHNQDSSGEDSSDDEDTADTAASNSGQQVSCVQTTE